jgi:hypothetical protein
MRKPSLLVCILFLVCTVFITENLAEWRRAKVLTWDAAAYHLYLPAIFIYDDLREMRFYRDILEKYRLADDYMEYGTHIHPETGLRVNKYAVGVAVFQLPLFLAVHTFSRWKYPDKLDGYNPDYHRAASYSTLLFVFLGLLFLRKFLLRYLSEKQVWPVLLIIGFGTNLFHYTAFDQGLSHPYLFFVYACILWYTARWYDSFQWPYALALGFLIGLAAITRPTDVFVAAIPALWALENKLLLHKLLWQKYGQILLACLAAAIPLLLQLGYWKLTTGQWIYYSYGEERFNFRDPHVLDGLFSYRKGWFIYTPLALLGFAGMYFVFRDPRFRFYRWGFVVYYLVTVYVLFSWHIWSYGGSFGSRVMVQSYPLLALPLGLLIQHVFAHRQRWRKILLASVLILGISLNAFQSYQYHKGIIHWDAMDKTLYWQRFLKHKQPQGGY